MSDKDQKDYGYIPSKSEKGYQPQKPDTQKPDSEIATGGYQPTTSQGDNPGNKPPPEKP